MSLPSLRATGIRVPRHIQAAKLLVGRSQRRTYARPLHRIAPSLRKKELSSRPVRRTAEQQAALDAVESSYQDLLDKARDLNMATRRNWTTQEKAYLGQTTLAVGEAMTFDQARFLAHWNQGLKETQSTLKKPHTFNDTLKILSPLTTDDVFDLTFILRNKGTVACARTGRDLVHQCAEAGHEEAIIQVIASALRQDAMAPGLLRSHYVLKALGRLRDVSKAGNVRAIVMEANVARHNGLVDQAIKLYERAVDLLAKQDENPSTDKYARQQDELSSPWIELGFLYVNQGQYVPAMKAYMIGLEKDDPTAYFNLARLDFRMTGDQYTHEWLYNMTKAAASGHYKAAHELGEYYANSAAPSKPQQTFAEKLGGFMSFLYSGSVNLDPEANIHHHNAYADTPEKRIILAELWLLVAHSNHYLPAYITLAELYLQKFIYAEGTLLKPLDPFGHSRDPNPIENPLFDPAKAQTKLTEVLTACLRIAEAKRFSKTNAEYLIKTQPWSHNEEVLEVIEDSKSLEELKATVEMICDAAGIDIISTDDLPEGVPHEGAMRPHKGTIIERGQGLWEADEFSPEDFDIGEEAK